MSPVSVLDERVLFARDIAADVNACLQAAVACAHDFDRARELLYRAKAMAPDQLEVYVALYKFLFYRHHLDEAQAITEEALQRAAMKGRFDADWQELMPDSADWMHSDGPERMYLYSLKALAFISLRKDRPVHSMAILAKLKQLDPQDQVGWSVIEQLASAGDED